MNSIILCDTREKKNKHILDYFDEIGQDYIITKLDAGDYALFRQNKTILDKKEGLLELSHNLCNSLDHARLKREIERAKNNGCVRFIFLIQDNKIKTVEDIMNWTSPHTKVKGATLYKIMCTMKERYDVNFIFCPKKKMGAKIIALLTKD